MDVICNPGRGIMEKGEAIGTEKGTGKVKQ